MNDWADMRLLREYAERGVEEAFTALVSRHLGMVYQAALRQTRRPELAEEIAQTVFTLLARKANRLSAGTLLAGWLFNTTRFVSARTVRDEIRRQRRQAEAARMNADASLPDPPEEAEPILSLLDDMLARLPHRDREALLARYFGGKSFVEVAAATGTTEEVARKRVQRALERLRGMLTARGATVSAMALAATLEAARAQALPAGLSAAAVSNVALQGASGAAALSAITRSTIELMKWTKIKVAGVAALALALGAGTTVYYLNRHAEGAAVPTLRLAAQSANADESAALLRSAEGLRAENAWLAAALAAAHAREAQPAGSRQDAERTARQSQDAMARSLAPTNGPPTMQDAFVSLGKVMRLSFLDRTNPSPGEKKSAYDTAAHESLVLMQAAARFDMDSYTPASPEEAAELQACMLQGLLDFDQQQFTRVRDTLAACETQALKDDPQHRLGLPELESMPGALEKIRDLLSEEQKDLVRNVLRRIEAGTGSNQSAPR